MAHKQTKRRTKKQAEKTKWYCIKFFLSSQDDVDELKRLAAGEDRKVSEYVRRLVLAAIQQNHKSEPYLQHENPVQEQTA